MTVFLWIGIVVLAVAIGVFGRGQEARRREAIGRAAVSLGWTYRPEAAGYIEGGPAAHPIFARGYNRARCLVEHDGVALFEYSWCPEHGMRRTTALAAVTRRAGAQPAERVSVTGWDVQVGEDGWVVALRVVRLTAKNLVETMESARAALGCRA